jgi:ATP-dependent helicase/nuclease subunit B
VIRHPGPRVLSIPPGAPFLPTLADALISGELVPGFRPGGDPLALSAVTIYLPTRRAARALRSIFVDKSPGGSAILPTIRALGEFDEELDLLDPTGAGALDVAPPIADLDRMLALAPLVQAWKSRLPAHVAALFTEEVVVPASAADALWLARDLGRLIDEMETAGADWARLAGLVDSDLADWWQLTLDFLAIVTEYWPKALAERQRSNPAAHRNAMIRAEAARLKRGGSEGPVIAAGSTGTIPATAELLAAIARLPQGAVVLPGLDKRLEAEAWALLGEPSASPSVYGHPQFGLRRLIDAIGLGRGDIPEIGVPPAPLAARATILSEALRPAESTEAWAANRAVVERAVEAGALADVTLIEAPNERDEALAVAYALRVAVAEPGHRAALVTSDRAFARRVASELLRFGITADDSAGRPLSQTPPAVLLSLMVEAVMRPGDPVAILSFLKQPLLLLGMDRAVVRHAAETIELVALRGGTGRPDIARLPEEFEARLARLSGDPHTPTWFRRIRVADIEEARHVLAALGVALLPLAALRAGEKLTVEAVARTTIEALEAVGRDASGDLGSLYQGEAGERLAERLRELAAAPSSILFGPREWPDILAALLAGQMVKPRQGADRAVAIWGALEGRLQSVDTLVCGGLNEGSWPGRADPDGFMSRVMKAGIDLDPPERRIGQAAHDFMMSAGAPRLVLARAARAGDAPSVPSRWLQRLTACIGEEPARRMRERGAELLAAARHHAGDAPENVAFAPRPKPSPPLAARPPHFSVTEIETLRRDPYAIYARRILKLDPLDPLLRDPSAAERGSLFHEILHRFTAFGGDANALDALDRLLAIARQCFDEEALPADVDAVWWPRFRMMAPRLIEWEASHRADSTRRQAEAIASRIEIGATGVTLSGRADRIDVKRESLADILDYKTGSSPSKVQAHTLVAPQLALEGALLMRGAFHDLGPLEPADLAYVRLKATGDVIEESILTANRNTRLGRDLAEEAWQRLERLLFHYRNEANGYLSRALPFREGDTSGAYDHLARVQEWSAAGEEGDGGEGGE